jgi:hypothetical protein
MMLLMMVHHHGRNMATMVLECCFDNNNDADAVAVTSFCAAGAWWMMMMLKLVMVWVTTIMWLTKLGMTIMMGAFDRKENPASFLLGWRGELRHVSHKTYWFVMVVRQSPSFDEVLDKSKT